MRSALTFDAGATKTAWAVICEDGTRGEHGVFPTPNERAVFFDMLRGILETYQDVDTVGVGIAGIVSPDHRNAFVCPNIPGLSHLEIATFIEDTTGKPAIVDNDGRLALVGERWLGAARETTSAVMLTIGTGVGGAVLQRGTILPHPTDLSQEVGHLVVDAHDPFPAHAGRGTVEALLGGRNLEERYGVSLADMATDAHAGKAEAIEFWGIVSHLFEKCIHGIHSAYGCKMVLIGGRGAADFDLYCQSKFSCTVMPAALGADAALYGAAKEAFARADIAAKDWDE